jgi:flagellin
MAFSIQTNVNSLIAQENLRVNSNFQSQTIQRLTSGFRINSSSDDAAGLAIANKFRSDTSELGQGVRNANDGISTLQIIDGGMSNISKMLDRLRVLATQSASDTFTGDRNVVNSEFQSLLTEIDRQSQSIGLDQNGQYAKSLSVFLGGGHAASTGALSTTNGTVAIDLTSSSVDTRSLGLTGMQVIAGSADIGNGSATHTVQQIVDNAANATSNNYTNFYFAGSGFSDSSKVKVAVNLQGVTDLNSLVSAVNTAIAGAGGGATQAATAFKNAGIVASVHTDVSGGQQLSFSSSTAAFQVQAGDRMANALMGSFSGGSTGNAIATSVTGAATTPASAFTPTGVTVRITGGSLTSPVDLTLSAGATTVGLATSELVSTVNSTPGLQAAGITASVDGTNHLVFSDARGEAFNVMASGDTSNALGLGGFVAGALNAPDYTTVGGSAAYNQAAAYGTAAFEFSINGGASSGNVVSVDLTAGDATAGKLVGTTTTGDAHGQALTITVDGVAQNYTLAAGSTTFDAAIVDINANFTGVTASLDSTGHMLLTSATKGAHSSIAASGAAATTLLGAVPVATAGQSRSAGDLVAALNAGFAANTTLTKAGLNATQVGGTVTIASGNGTEFRLNTAGTGANANIGFGVSGVSFTSTLSTAAAANATVADATGTVATGALGFAALAYGNDDQSISISANDSNGAMQSKTITLANDAGSRSGRTIDESIAYINSQLQQSNNATLQKIVAVKDNSSGTEKINFVSSLKSFNVSVGSTVNGAAGTGDGVGNGVAALVGSAANGTGGGMSVDTKGAASSAIVAVAAAVSKLGAAQAAVGKGQNQLNYAIGLAQSQISSFSAAESRIRDADVAAEAANLTKAQVLQQASMAAMAQANSAPQAVLALLRG